MKSSLRIVSLILMIMLVGMSVSMGASVIKSQPNSPYIILEGKVSSAKARSLVIDGQSYPISMFVRVFHGDEKGPETTMQTISNIGKIDKARIYLLGGKVEKIIVLNNI